MKRLTVALSICLCLLGGISSAQAAYPERPITIVLPQGAGSGADNQLRLILPFMKEALGVDIVVEYKNGAGGTMGSNYYMTVKPDGYTLLNYSEPHVTLQSIFTKTSYNNRNLTPVFGQNSNADIISVRAESPFKTFQDLVDYAKANPGKLKIGNTASYSVNHMTFAQLIKDTGIEAVRVPFENGGKMNLALLAGDIDAACSNMDWVDIYYPGKIRALGIADSKRPNPDVPTFTELGYPGLVDIRGMGIFYVHSNAPQEAIDYLREKLAPLCHNEEVKAVVNKNGKIFEGYTWQEAKELADMLEKKVADLKPTLEATLH